MEQIVATKSPDVKISSYKEAWGMITSQLHMEMSRALYETWVKPLKPIGYKNGIFAISACNPYTRDWVETRLKGRISRMLEGLFNETITLQVEIANGYYPSETRASGEGKSQVAIEEPIAIPKRKNIEPQQQIQRTSNRKVMLQRAYGSKRASIVQPERGMFVTLYFFNQWLPLLRHSAFATILAARSMCYWNPMTGELRNEVETDMSELARRAAVSVRTVKAVLNNELVKKYFLRYKVRRVMTPNGVRTAGIWMQVRMDDPLIPDDQAACDLPDDEQWHSPEFEEEST